MVTVKVAGTPPSGLPFHNWKTGDPLEELLVLAMIRNVDLDEADNDQREKNAETSHAGTCGERGPRARATDTDL